MEGIISPQSGSLKKRKAIFLLFPGRLETDPELGFSAYPERQKFQYVYADFYKAATDKTCDIFRCEENGRIYVPASRELFIYHEPQQKAKDSVIASLSKNTSKQNQSSQKSNHEPER